MSFGQVQPISIHRCAAADDCNAEQTESNRLAIRQCSKDTTCYYRRHHAHGQRAPVGTSSRGTELVRHIVRLEDAAVEVNLPRALRFAKVVIEAGRLRQAPELDLAIVPPHSASRGVSAPRDWARRASARAQSQWPSALAPRRAAEFSTSQRRD